MDVAVGRADVDGFDVDAEIFEAPLNRLRIDRVFEESPVLAAADDFAWAADLDIQADAAAGPEAGDEIGQRARCVFGGDVVEGHGRPDGVEGIGRERVGDDVGVQEGNAGSFSPAICSMPREKSRPTGSNPARLKNRAWWPGPQPASRIEAPRGRGATNSSRASPGMVSNQMSVNCPAMASYDSRVARLSALALMVSSPAVAIRRCSRLA